VDVDEGPPVDQTNGAPDSAEIPHSDQTPKKRFVQSAKIKALMSELEKMMKEGDDKALVFSQWTRMLDLISVPLTERGIRFERLDGTMDCQSRTAAISEFKKRSDIRVFLISLKAGGVGLNLTAANRVIMMDCWWYVVTRLACTVLGLSVRLRRTAEP
jgi:SNF2 family DNA or RNA helicase